MSCLPFFNDKRVKNASGNCGNGLITVNPETNNPQKVWQKQLSSQKYKVLEPISAETPVKENHLRVVCISDTHGMTNKTCMVNIPHGDILIHAGDFTRTGQLQEVTDFNHFLGQLPHKHKIVICGNHELSFDPTKRKGVIGRVNPRDYLTNCKFLEDSGTSVEGIKIYGSPWQPEFMGWAFNIPRGQELLDKWNLIPDDTDILITHGPPLGHGDFTKYGSRAGCVELLSTIQKRVKPKYHIFGHIHEDPGVTTDETTIFINASTCNLGYKPVNPPIIFDYPLPTHTEQMDEVTHCPQTTESSKM